MSNVYRFHLDDNNIPVMDVIIGAGSINEALSYFILEFPDNYSSASIINYGIFYSFTISTEKYTLTYTIYEAKYKIGKIL